MPRKKSLHIGCLNIVSHPHETDQYLDLFYFAAKQPSVQIGDHQYCRIRQIHPISESNPRLGIRGKIFKHLKLSPDDEWLDANTDRPATPEEVEDILPDHLLPGLIQFDFVFYPEGHRLFFAMKNEKKKTISAKSGENIFKAVFGLVEHLWDEPIEIHVHVETSQEGVEKLFSMHHVKTIEYEVALPNPDEGNGAQDKFKKRLEKQNIRKQHTKLQSAKGQSITPDDETKTELNVAASNGFVTAIGSKEDGSKDEVSTKDHPFTQKVIYEQTLPFYDVLVRYTPRLLQSILDRFG